MGIALPFQINKQCFICLTEPITITKAEEKNNVVFEKSNVVQKSDAGSGFD